MVTELYNRWQSGKKRCKEYILSPRLKQTCKRYAPPYKVHLGCGSVKLPGWINVDLYANPPVTDAQWDITRPFPLASECCSHLYSEHVIEHFSVEESSAVFTECYRLLIKGGTLRIAMPSLASLVDAYQSEDWKNQDWLTGSESVGIRTRAEMLNVAFRNWGHKWLYDEEELVRRLAEAGFAETMFMGWGDSLDPQLRALERRKDSKLICEAYKR